MKTLGIIPAAGKAERFGGLFKELLPVDRIYSFITRVAFSMETSTVIVVTNASKISEHAASLGPRVLFKLQWRDQDIWSAMKAGMSVEAERYWFGMPDTYFPLNTFLRDPGDDFVLGIFTTDKPERFGVLHQDHIVNKEPGVSPTKAWGVLMWSRKVRDFWMNSYYNNYTDAINGAMKAFGYDTIPMEFYYDMATFQDYKDFLAVVDA